MKELLPIGSIINLNTATGKVMVAGYGIDETNNVIGYDYKGVFYPDGVKTVTFNQSDIFMVEFEGFKDNSFKAFSEKFKVMKNNQSVSNTSSNKNPFEVQAVSSINEVAPVVGEAPKSALSDDAAARASLENINNNFQYKLDENGNVVGQGDVNYIFDENGVVIGTESEEKIADTTEYTFDENGVVIASSDDVAEPAKASDTTEYTFDENGVVIASSDDVAETAKPADTTEYTFDENGVVIASSDDVAEPAKPADTTEYTFDENGVVVGASD